MFPRGYWGGDYYGADYWPVATGVAPPITPGVPSPANRFVGGGSAGRRFRPLDYDPAVELFAETLMGQEADQFVPLMLALRLTDM